MEVDQDREIPIGIPEFYNGRSVFVTGFSGYLGKLLVEKLLYSCPEINKIYVLIRAKKGQNFQERFKHIIDSMAFDRVRKKYPGCLESKLVTLKGDMLEEKLGLSCEDEELLRREVSVIFHGAASVRFDDPLHSAVRVNTLGAKKIVDLALTMPNLSCLVYISTAYTNCDRLHIEEKIYPPKANWRDILKINERVDQSSIQILSRKCIDELPNTYVFSKSLSEQIMTEYSDRLPVVIVRPSIVISACKEPMEGWVDSLSGPVAMLVVIFLGLIRCSWVDVKTKCNYIHSDFVVNSFIIASWKTSLIHNSSSVKKCLVYNACAPDSYSVQHSEFVVIMTTHEETMKELSKKGISFLNVSLIGSELWFRLSVLYKHVLPSIIIDSVLILMKKEPALLKLRRKLFQMIDLSLTYFTHRTFTFENTNYLNLVQDLNPEDKESFGWKFDKSKFQVICNKGYLIADKTILKTLYEDFETNRRRLKMLYLIDRGSVYLTYILLAWFIYALRLPQAVLFFITGLVFF